MLCLFCHTQWGWIIEPIAVLGLGALLSLFLLKIMICLSSALLSNQKIEKIEVIEPLFIPIYVSYFIVGLGINTIPMLIFILLLLSILLRSTPFYYFNPLLKVFNWHFYSVRYENTIFNTLVLLKTKNLKNSITVSLYKLNEFTFIKKFDKKES